MEAQGEDPGVGEHDVDRAELCYTRLERRLQRRPVAHIGLDCVDAAIQGLYLPHRLLQVVGR